MADVNVTLSSDEATVPVPFRLESMTTTAHCVSPIIRRPLLVSLAILGHNRWMAAAVTGLLGVIIGASMNGLIQWYSTRRSDQRITRTAARLVAYELLQYRELMTYAVHVGHWEPLYWTSPVRWQSYQSQLASPCTPKEWTDLTRAYLGIEIVDSWHRPQLGVEHPRKVVSDPEAAGIPVILTNVKTALTVLNRLSMTDGFD
jgi:hypothetical protein